MAYYQGGYTHQNPAYQGTGEKYRNDTSVPMSNVAMVPDAPRYSWCTPCWGVCSIWFCGLWGICCGMLGLLCSMWSYTDHKSGDYERAEYKKRWAIGCIVLAILLGLACIAGILVLIFAFPSVICENVALKSYLEELNINCSSN